MDTPRPLYQAATYRAENSTDYLVNKLAQVVACEVDRRMIDRLEAKALIRRIRCADERRVVHLELSEAGKQVVAEVSKILAH
ncbi:MAG: hypothetical protein WBO95_15260 [Candidatus Dechloromonas phosphoritropha]|jgi:16S rRNA A1518/A1519 N6-dimethyltransferase RsmA/KsgA/DIM1 with predicted DNA glycosylase/AP lyase activity